MGWYVFSSYNKEFPGKKESYGDFEACEEKNANGRPLYMLPGLLTGSDYSNTNLVHVANFNSFLKTFRRVNGVVELYGGYGTFAVAVRKDVYEENEDVRQTLDALEEYPLLDEEEHSKLEVEAQDEAWDDFARRDFLEGIQKVIEDYEPDDDFRSFFEECREEVNEYWENESSDSMFIRTEKIISYAVDQLLLQRTAPEDLPTLMGRTWSTRGLANEFERRLKGEKP